MKSLRSTFSQAVLIALLGVLAGLVINHQQVIDAFSGRLAATPPPATAATARLPQPVLLAEVRELVAAGALPVDARDATLYAEGHLPGAYSLMLGEIDAGLDGFRRSVDAGRTLVVYCNGYGCPDSFDLGVRLLEAGYVDVRVFEGGFPEWRDAGLAVVKGGP